MNEGIPKKIMSDQGSDFTSNVVQNLCEIMDVKKIETGAYSPETNGSIERFNRTLAAALRQISSDVGVNFGLTPDWDLFVGYIAANHNAKFSSRIGMTPNKAYHGVDRRLPIDSVLHADFCHAAWRRAFWR